MYMMDYEEAAIAYLRILKYLHLYNPERTRFAADSICGPMDDDLYSKLYEALFELADEMYEEEDDDGSCVTILSDRTFNEFIRLSSELYGLNPSSMDAARKRFDDVVSFFFISRSSGITDVSLTFDGCYTEVRLYSYGEGQFEDYIFALTDLFFYVQRANEAMRKQLEAQKEKILTLPQNTEKTNY